MRGKYVEVSGGNVDSHRKDLCLLSIETNIWYGIQLTSLIR